MTLSGSDGQTDVKWPKWANTAVQREAICVSSSSSSSFPFSSSCSSSSSYSDSPVCSSCQRVHGVPRQPWCHCYARPNNDQRKFDSPAGSGLGKSGLVVWTIGHVYQREAFPFEHKLDFHQERTEESFSCLSVGEKIFFGENIAPPQRFKLNHFLLCKKQFGNIWKSHLS